MPNRFCYQSHQILPVCSSVAVADTVLPPRQGVILLIDYETFDFVDFQMLLVRPFLTMVSMRWDMYSNETRKDCY
jgi:hypothetical protein